MKNKLVLIRGLPGSGKSTLAKWLCYMQNYGQPSEIVEADQFFMDEEEDNYHFDKSRLEYAHQYCFSNTAKHLHDEKTVYVANTFTKFREVRPYIDLGLFFNVKKIEIIQCLDNFGSVHNVPDLTLKNMKERWRSNEDIKNILNIKVHNNDDEEPLIEYFTHKDGVLLKDEY